MKIYQTKESIMRKIIFILILIIMLTSCVHFNRNVDTTTDAAFLGGKILWLLKTIPKPI